MGTSPFSSCHSKVVRHLEARRSLADPHLDTPELEPSPVRTALAPSKGRSCLAHGARAKQLVGQAHKLAPRNENIGQQVLPGPIAGHWWWASCSLLKSKCCRTADRLQLNPFMCKAALRETVGCLHNAGSAKCVEAGLASGFFTVCKLIYVEEYLVTRQGEHHVMEILFAVSSKWACLGAGCCPPQLCNTHQPSTAIDLAGNCFSAGRAFCNRKTSRQQKPKPNGESPGYDPSFQQAYRSPQAWTGPNWALKNGPEALNVLSSRRV